MKTRKRLCYAATLLALISLASCGQNDSDDTLLPAGKYPMTFTTWVNGLAATRATTDNSWDGGEQVALQVGDEVKEYQISGSGHSATLTSSDPFYWTSTKEAKTVQGWYCGNGYSPALNSWQVASDQSAADHSGYKASDFLYAPAKDISFGSDNKSLNFYHQTARVVINILNEEAATNASQIKGVAFGDGDNLALSGTYTAPDGKANFGTWDTASGASMGTITPKAIDTPAGGSYLKSYTALLIPQNMQSKKFIAITLDDDQTYYYIPEKDDDANFEAGKEYTYDVTVQHEHLDAVLVSVNGTWGGGDTEEVKSTAPGFSAYDLKIGDYYYSDGSTSDGGYRKYADGTIELLDIDPVLTSANGVTQRIVIGIVFWVGDATKKDDTLADEHPGCTHGLVVALNDAVEEAAWQSSRSSVQDWLNNNRPDKYLPVASFYNTSDPVHNIQGYNNTKAIEEFNEGNAGSLIQAVSTVVNYRKNVLAPKTSSDWYLPSEKELTLLCGKDVDDIWINRWGIGTANKDLINNKIGLIGKVATEISSAFYWSSTEGDNYYAFYVDFDLGRVNYGYKDTNQRVRCILAF